MPRVAWSTVELLERLGCEVDVPAEQTCCGQPAFNTGYQGEAREIARHWIKTFRHADTIVAPSGSCTSMVKVFFKDLFEPDSEEGREAARLADRTFELTQFIVHEMGVTDVGARYDGKVAYHASCHLLRELHEGTSPKALLDHVAGAEHVALGGDQDVCCGFGGTFSVKLPELSTAMLDDKIGEIDRSGADCVVACDAGCLLHIDGGLSRRGNGQRAFHIAELLTGKIPPPE